MFGPGLGRQKSTETASTVQKGLRRGLGRNELIGYRRFLLRYAGGLAERIGAEEFLYDGVKLSVTSCHPSTQVQRPKLPSTYMRSLEPAASSFLQLSPSARPCPMEPGHCCAPFSPKAQPFIILPAPAISVSPTPVYRRTASTPLCLSLTLAEA